MKILRILGFLLTAVAFAQTTVTIGPAPTRRLQPTVPWITFPPVGLRLDDIDASNQLIFTNGSNMTGNRTFTLKIGDADTTVDFSGATTGNFLTYNGTSWVPGSGGAGTGDVVGPASSTDNAVVRFDATTGKLIQNSSLTLSDVASSTVTLSASAGNVFALSGGTNSGGVGYSQVTSPSGVIITGQTGTGGAGATRGDMSLILRHATGAIMMMEDTSNPSGTYAAGTSDSGFTTYAYDSTGSSIKTFSLATGFYINTHGSDVGMAVLNPTYSGGLSAQTLKVWGGTSGGSAAFFSAGNTALSNGVMAVFGKQFIGDGTIDSSRNLNLIGLTSFITKIRRATATDYTIFKHVTGSTDNWDVGQNASTNYSFYNYGTGAAAFTLTYADSTATFAGNLIGSAKFFAGDGTLDTSRNVNFIGATDMIVKLRRSANTRDAVHEFVTASTQKWIVGLRAVSTDDYRIFSTTLNDDALSIAQATGFATFTGRILAKGDANTIQGTLSNDAPYVSLTNVNAWAGSGSTANAALGANSGSLNFYTNGSVTAGAVLSTANNWTVTGNSTSAGVATTTISASGDASLASVNTVTISGASSPRLHVIGTTTASGSNTGDNTFVAGTNVTLTLSGSTLTISAAGSGNVTGSSLTSGNVIVGAGTNAISASTLTISSGTISIPDGIELGAATDTTITRVSAGDIGVEGNRIFRVGGVDVPVADGGTGLSSGNSGGILGFTAAGTIASSTTLSASAIVVGGGAGATPTTLALGSGNQIVGMNTGGTANEYKTLVAGTNVTLTFSAGTVTLSASGGGSVADPTGTIGLAAVNGVLTTALRSDGAPALSQAIAPTWSAAHIFSVAGAASVPAVKVSGVPFAGTGTTSFPQFYVTDASATASTTLNTAGTYFGVNGDGTQDLANFLKDGLTALKIASTGATTQTQLALATTPVFGFLATNTTAAAAGAQQVSPGVRWTGQGWSTNSGGASMAVDFMTHVLPVQGAAAPTATWKLQSSVNASAFADRLTVTSSGDVTVVGGNLSTSAGALTVATSISAGTSIKSTSATAGIGYAATAGGTVTQGSGSGRSTGVTLNKVCGQITTDTTSLAALASASFTVTDSAVVATDVIALSIVSGQTTKQTMVYVTAVGSGTFEITVNNMAAVTAETGAIVINFAVIKAVTS